MAVPLFDNQSVLGILALGSLAPLVCRNFDLSVGAIYALSGVIMAMVVPKVLGRQKHASIDATRVSIGGLSQALKLYSLDHGGDFPSATTGLEVLLKKPASADLGTISRVAIADRTGLPRETVRRKINALIKAGLVAEERPGNIRTVLDITAPNVMEAIQESYKAVRRYQLNGAGRQGAAP